MHTDTQNEREWMTEGDKRLLEEMEKRLVSNHGREDAAEAEESGCGWLESLGAELLESATRASLLDWLALGAAVAALLVALPG